MLPFMRTKVWQSAGSRALATITAQTAPGARIGSPARQSASSSRRGRCSVRAIMPMVPARFPASAGGTRRVGC